MKRILVCLVLFAMLLGMVACDPGTGAGAGTTAPVADNTPTTEPTVTNPEPELPGVEEFSIVYADDASAELQALATAIQAYLKAEYAVDVPINPETPSANEIALGACRTEAVAIKDALGVNSYAIKAIKTANGICIAAVGNNERSTLAAIERFAALLEDTAWESVLALDVADTLDIQKPQNISFYGDSITTYEKISDSGLYNSTLVGQAVYYNTERMTRNDMLMSKNETWWGLTLAGLDAELCVNNSYSGDATTSQYAMKRAENLHRNFQNKIQNPDTIIVYFGINDYHAGADSTFRANYRNLISIMQTTYPDATIFCCTLLPRVTEKDARIEAYNTNIRSVVEELGVELIDFYEMIGEDYRANLMTYTIEGCHPFKSGMKVMGDAAVKAIEAWYYGE